MLDFVLEDARCMKRHSMDATARNSTSTSLASAKSKRAFRGPSASARSSDPDVDTPHGHPADRALCRSCSTCCRSRSRPIPRASPRSCWATMATTVAPGNRHFRRSPRSDASLSELGNDPEGHGNRPLVCHQFAKFLEKWSTKDVDGQSLLHNSMIVYGAAMPMATGTRTRTCRHSGGRRGRRTHPGAMSSTATPMTNLFLTLARTRWGRIS